MAHLNTCYLVGLFVFWALTWIGPAHAAEAFLCNDGRLIYVETKDIERMKKTEPCVAAHYDAEISRKSTRRSALKPHAVLRTKRAVTAKADRRAPAKPQMQLKRLQEDTLAPAPYKKAEVKLETLPKRKPQLKKQPQPPVASKADYRNVPVINASSKSERWYYHNQ